MRVMGSGSQGGLSASGAWAPPQGAGTEIPSLPDWIVSSDNSHVLTVQKTKPLTERAQEKGVGVLREGKAGGISPGEQESVWTRVM